MPVSEQTLRELEAGARAVAKVEGRTDLAPGQMEAVLNTQQRYLQLKQWERDGVIEIEMQTRYHTNAKDEPARSTLIRVGEHTFSDPIGEERGQWPSELLMAQVALAVMAGQGRK